jgi:two-component system osmolarity sensor histidine kinase EnvZ
VFVCVADHGPGVHPDLLQRLGQPFLRGDRARSTAGTGLGLSIAGRASGLHGGSLQSSVPPEGGFVALLLLRC